MLNVLIVEVDPMVAQINRTYLEKIEGFTLAGVVHNAVAALDFLDAASVSLLLLDVFMPGGMNGLHLLGNLRQQHPSVDVIMVTATRASADIQAALRMGVIDYVVKPFTAERFQAALIAYRERMRLLRAEEELDQDLLDRGILANSSRAPLRPAELPKGIDAQTLRMVREITAGYGGEFSVRDIVPIAGISRVSLTKYLAYLEQKGEIGRRLVYQPVGRPLTLYRVLGGSGCGLT